MRQGARPILIACLSPALSLAIGPLAAQAPNGWIQDSNWLLLGPLENAAGCDPMAAVEENWIAPEEISTITPADGDPIDIDFNQAASGSWQGVGDTPAWSCLSNLGQPQNDLVDLLQIAGVLAVASGKAIPGTNAMAVLVTYVENLNPEPLPVSVCTASDDSLQVWVNDQKVQEVHACRGTAGGCAEEAPALLAPGTNAIKVLLWQGTGGWSFRLRLNRLDSGPITSDDPEITFSCSGTDPVSLNAYRIQRRLSADIPECSVPGGALDVVLDGSGATGANVTITEHLTGSVTVDNITAGGVFTPTPLPVPNPVGIFDGTVDVGSPCSTGSVVQGPAGTYAVTGSGFDIWTEGDQFNFAYKALHGDFTMTAHVADRQWAPGSRWGKAGLMARQSFAGKSRYASIQTHGEDLQDADRFASRPTHGGNDNFEATNLPAGEHRDWLRLERTGPVVTGSFSSDGATWESAGFLDWGDDAPHTLLVGLEVCSHSGCLTSQLTFDLITIEGGNQNPGSPAADGGAIVWSNLPRATLDAGVGYRLRGRQRVSLFGDDGEHAIEGTADVFLQPAAAKVGIFDSSQDIGQPCGRGSTDFDPAAETYSVTAGGNDIWIGVDQFQYAYSRVKGDFSLRAHFRERNWAPGARWGKGGVMARETCQSDSRYSFLHDSPEPDSTRYAIQRLTNQGGNQEFGVGGHPEWLRMDRVGASFAGYASDDGVIWTLRYKEDWSAPVPDTVLLGLAYTSHGGCATGNLVFDQVTLSPIDYKVTRHAGEGLAGCPPPGAGSSVTVKLVGTGPAGPNVLVSEQVRGQVDVQNISNGGVFVPNKKPEYHPLGIWADTRDIGAACYPGTTVDRGDGSYEVTGGGVDIWQTGDQFQFAYLEANGDFSLTARMAERTWAAGSRWGKVGIMARQSHDPYSRYVSVQDHGIDLQDQTRWASRPTHGGADNYETVPLLAFEHHDWLRLERVGDLFIGSSSLDGSSWIEQGREAWSNAPKTVLLGLHVLSHMDCNPATIVFDSIEYTGGNGAAGTVSDGGTISWNVPRAALNTGVSYRVTATGNRFAAFDGTSDGVAITGDSSFAISAVEDLPAELSLSHDIGAPCAQGNTAFDPDSGEYSVTGSGTDIWQGGDQFQFAYREIAEENFTAVAHIKERIWAPSSRWGKVGIMARQDCTPRSRYAMIQDHGVDPQDQTRFAARPTHGGADNFEQWTLAGGTHRDWLRLDRAGSVFTGYTSSDGQLWEQQGTVNFGASAPPTVMLGLAVCSHSGCVPATIVYDNWKVVTGVNNPPVACVETDPPSATVVLQNGNAEITLRGTCSTDGDGGTQQLSYLWSRTGGPSGLAIIDRTAAVTRVTFTKLGNYKFRLTVNDGQFTNNSAIANVDVAVVDQPPPSGLRRGDVDANGTVEITDAVNLLSFLFLGAGNPPCLEAGDTDNNGVTDITDAITNLNYQFLGGTPPAPPGPFNCGVDPAPPNLGCEAACQ